jgi:hypothetical protein
MNVPKQPCPPDTFDSLEPLTGVVLRALPDGNFPGTVEAVSPTRKYCFVRFRHRRRPITARAPWPPGSTELQIGDAVSITVRDDEVVSVVRTGGGEAEIALIKTSGAHYAPELPRKA